MSVSIGLGGLRLNSKEIANKAFGILTRPSVTSVLWLPGVGYVSGFAALNYTDDAFTTPAAVDSLVGSVRSPISALTINQTVAGTRPTLRRGLVNYITNSHNRANGSWTGANFVANSATSVSFTSGYQVGTYTGPSSGVTYTQAIELSGTPGDTCNIYLQDNGGAFAATIVPVTLTATPKIYTVSRTVTVASVLCGINSNSGTKTIQISKTGLFRGALTAAQVIAAGGIPTTSVSPASSATGPYFWSAIGSKSLTGTFPAGWESTTVIDAAPTGQTTLNAQNVVGAYTISADTCGRIFVVGTLSGNDLLALQRFANSLAGL